MATEMEFKGCAVPTEQDIRRWVLQDVSNGREITEAFIKANWGVVSNEVDVRESIGKWVLDLVTGKGPNMKPEPEAREAEAKEEAADRAVSKCPGCELRRVAAAKAYMEHREEFNEMVWKLVTTALEGRARSDLKLPLKWTPGAVLDAFRLAIHDLEDLGEPWEGMPF
jgi:hypothetical protein